LERYEFPHFVTTADGPVEFRLAAPKGKSGALVIRDLLIKHHGPAESAQAGAKVE
jgi:hypothetical protein